MQCVLGYDKAQMPSFYKRSCFILVTCLALLALSGCISALEKPSCAQMDWYEIGRSDGAQGMGLEALAKHKETCGESFSANGETIYINGRNSGLVEYCSEENGFDMGRMGVLYTYVCPSTMEPQFLAQYEKGQNARMLEMENAKLDARIAMIFQRLNIAQSNGEKADLNFELKTIQRLRAQNSKTLETMSQ